MGFLIPKQQQQAAPLAPPTTASLPDVKGPSPAMAPQGAKPKKRSGTPTFLGGDSTPMSSNVGGKTLLGA